MGGIFSGIVVAVVIAIQAVMNLIADWNKEKATHDLAEEVAERYVDCPRSGRG